MKSLIVSVSLLAVAGLTACGTVHHHHTTVIQHRRSTVVYPVPHLRVRVPGRVVPRRAPVRPAPAPRRVRKICTSGGRKYYC